MAGKSLAIAIVGIAAVAAAGTGGYLALRMNASETVDNATPVSVTTASTAAAQAEPAAVEPPTPPAEPAPVAPRPRTARSESTPRPAGSQRQPPDRAESIPPPVEVPTLPPPAPAATLPVDPVPPPLPTLDPAPIPEPPMPVFDEVTLGEDAVIGIRMDQTISSSTAKVEDRVTARVTRDITVDGRVAVPAGAWLEGVVSAVEKGGKVRTPAHIEIRFNTLVLMNSTRVPIRTAVITRDGEPPAGEAGAKIGASAVVGAILGAVIGGKKGAAIGSAAGAAGGTAAVMAGDVNAATIQAGSLVTVRLTAPVKILVEREPTS
jgi:hypothetical protein